MFNTEEFISKFLEAAKSGSAEQMQELSSSIAKESFDFRLELLEKLLEALKKDSEISKELVDNMESTYKLMLLSVEYKDSTGVEGTDTPKPEEVTQDVAADTSAEDTAGERTKGKSGAETQTVVESEGTAPAEEVEAEKTEQ